MTTTKTLKVGDYAVYDGVNPNARGKLVKITDVRSTQLIYEFFNEKGDKERGGHVHQAFTPVTKASDWLKVGDRVVVVTKPTQTGKRAPLLKPATVKTFTSKLGTPGLVFDEPFLGGHDLDGHCATGYGHYVEFSALQKISEPTPAKAPAEPPKTPVTTAEKAFKVGDRVRLKKTGTYLNIIYPDIIEGVVVGTLFSHPDRARIRWDRVVSHADGARDFSWYVPFEVLEHVAEKPAPATASIPEEYVLMLFKNGTYLPAEKPKVYKTESQAKRVAREMTQRHGDEFRVMKLCGISKAREIKKVEAELTWG